MVFYKNILNNRKRVPNKNLILVDGYPLMYYVIDAFKKSGLGYISMEEFNEVEEVNPIYSYIKLPDFNVDEYIEILKKGQKEYWR